MAQRVIVGAVKLKKLKAISYWVRKLSNQGNDDPDINTLDNVTLHDLVVEMNAKEEDKERDSLNLKPKDFDAKDFDDWSKSFIVYLDTIAGEAGTPLSYVVRSEDADPDDATNVHDRGQRGWLVQFSKRTILWFTVHCTTYLSPLPDSHGSNRHQMEMAERR